MAEYGISASQTSVPLAYAGDYQKAIDSRWKILEIAVEQIVDFTVSSWSVGVNIVKFYSHNLGYSIPFELVDLGSSIPDLKFPEFWSLPDGLYMAVIHASGDPTTAMTIKKFLRAYDLNIVETYAAPKDTPSFGPSQDLQPVGVAIVNRDVPSSRMGDTDMQRFSLNTQAKPFNIHMHGLAEAKAPDFNIVVNHSLGYLPTFMVAETRTQGTKWYDGVYDTPGVFVNKLGITYFGQVFGLARSDLVTLTIRGGQAALQGKYAYLVLKDPVVIAA